MMSSEILLYHIKSFAIIQDHVILIRYHRFNLSESTVNDKKTKTTKKYPFFIFFVRFYHFINFLSFEKGIFQKKVHFRNS